MDVSAKRSSKHISELFTVILRGSNLLFPYVWTQSRCRFSLVGVLGGSPMSSMSPFITAVSLIKSKNCPAPPPIFVDHDKNFFGYVFNLCMTKANLTSITSLRMQTLLPYWNIEATTIEITKVGSIRLQLHDAIYRPDSFVLMLRYCANLKVIRHKSTSFNRIVGDKLHRVIAS